MFIDCYSGSTAQLPSLTVMSRIRPSLAVPGMHVRSHFTIGYRQHSMSSPLNWENELTGSSGKRSKTSRVEFLRHERLPTRSSAHRTKGEISQSQVKIPNWSAL